MPDQKKVAPAAGVAACIAAAVAICVPVLTRPSEGLRTHPYLDTTGKATVCYGETERAMRDYTPDECAVMLQARQARDYAPAVAACVPNLATTPRRNAFAASIDASYNAGTAAFCRSPMAAAFNAGLWTAGCGAFSHWYITAKVHGKPTVLKGLVARRAAERTLCLKGL